MFPAGVCDDLNNLGGDGSVCGDSGHAISFMLGPADVIAMYSCSPPPMRYFAYDLIIDQRLTEEYPFKPGQNFGDTISSRTINTTAEDDDVFDQPALSRCERGAARGRRLRRARRCGSANHLCALRVPRHRAPIRPKCRPDLARGRTGCAVNGRAPVPTRELALGGVRAL